MKKFTTIFKILISFVITCSLLAIIRPIAAFAALSQSAEVKNSITVETIDSLWSNKNGDLINELNLPKYVVPGEEVDVGEGIYLKNIGVNAYARIKFESKINGVSQEAFNVSINSNWVKGNDEYYYYCNQATHGVLLSNEINLVIESLSILGVFTNNDSDADIKLILTAEVLDAAANEYVEGWGEKPPQAWFDLIN